MTEKRESLGQSYRQARRELAVMLGAWLVAAAWVTGCGALLSRPAAGEEIVIWLGMPRWVVITVALPWLVADGFIVWFALRFMKDTDLEGEAGREGRRDA